MSDRFKNLVTPELNESQQIGQQVWSYLDDLAKNDPKQYKEMLKQQTKDMQQDHEERFADKYFAPTPMFCIKTISRSKNGDKGTKFFVNFCGTKYIDTGRFVPETLQPSDGKQGVPMAITKIRKGKDNADVRCLYVDVVMHIDLITHFQKDARLRRGLIELTCRDIEAANGIQLKKEYKLLSKRKYFGDGPLKQLKPDVMKKQKEIQKMRNSTEIVVPGSSDSGEISTEKSVLIGEGSVKKGDSKPMICEVSNSGKECTSSKLKESPHYVLNDSGNCMILRIDLPLEKSSAGLEIDICVRDIYLESKNYSLNIQLPRKIDIDTSTAKFNKKKRSLKICLPMV
eukprot:124043_1